MALSSEEKKTLQTFSSLNLNKIQVETILRRKLTDREWRSYIRDYKQLFSNIAKQAANVATKKFKVKNAKPSDENIELLRIEKQRKKYQPYIEDTKRIFKQVSLEAAKKASIIRAKQLKNQALQTKEQNKPEINKQKQDAIK
jgi:hypothetical protein